MKPVKYFYSIILLAGIVSFSSCGKDDEEGVDDFDRQQMLVDVGDKIILPAFQSFESKTAVLEDAAVNFSTDISQEKLDVLQVAWLETALAWKYAEMFMFGPVDQQNVAAIIDNWPTYTAGIENSINTTEEINSAYIESIGSTRKGIPAIEYLLFNFNGDDNAILNSFSGDNKRVQFLVALTERLNQIATAVNAAWKPTGGNYYETFINSTGKDVASSTNMLANEFLKLIEKIKNNKLGIPIGKKSEGVLFPEQVEARFSGESIMLMQRNLDAIEDVFTGDINNNDGLGYADYLNTFDAKYQDQLLSEAIVDQIAELRTKLDLIPVPLKTAVETHFNLVDEAYTSSQRLVVLTKADMMSQLGLLVSYTDNDGD